jgi:small subunit ribosomal protein S14
LARKCLINKQRLKPKFSSRAYTRCQFCGRARAVYRKFGICRICFRNMSLRGEIPGVRKASW